MKNIIALLIKFFMISLCICQPVYSWSDKTTHPAITDNAVHLSTMDGYLKNQLGISQGLNAEYQTVFYPALAERMADLEPGRTTRSVLDWIKTGSQLEDKTLKQSRSRHHFHDPIHNSGLDNRTDHNEWQKYAPAHYGFDFTGESALDWAIKGTSNKIPTENLETWNLARRRFYNALTYATKSDRDSNMALALLSLGSVTHLLEDQGVPAHTRNDFLFGHYKTWYDYPWGNDFENWTEKIVENNGGQCPWSGNLPVVFDKLAKYFDSDVYSGSYLGNGVLPPNNWGLSECSNYQFLSTSTMFGCTGTKYQFPQPSKEHLGADIIVPVTEGKKIYFNGSNYGVSHIARKSYTQYFADEHGIHEEPIDNTNTTDDQKVFDDYANITIPRTINYATGLLNYFFRGKLKVEPNWTDPNYPKFIITNDSNNSGIAQTLKGGTFEIYHDDINDTRIQIDPNHITFTPQWTSASTLAYDANIIITFAKPAEAHPVKYIALYKGNICQNVSDPDPCDANAIAVCSIRPGFEIVAWGRNDYNQISNVPAGADFIAVAAGRRHGLALKSDGSIRAWGSNLYGQCNVPADGNVVYTAIAAGSRHSIALKSDGSIVVWGDNSLNQITNKPTGNNFIAIAAGEYHSLALKNDGTIVGWGGYNSFGECDAPSPDEGTVYVGISAGIYHSMGLQSDGMPKAWGSNNQGQTRFYSGITAIAQVAACSYYSMVLRDDQWITTWGNGDWVTPNVLPRYHHRPADGNDFVAVAAGWDHILTLTSDGKVFAYDWPMGDYPFESFSRDVPDGVVFAVGQEDEPQTSISAGYDFSLALKIP